MPPGQQVAKLFRSHRLRLPRAPLAVVLVNAAIHLGLGPIEPVLQLVEPFQRFAIVQFDRRKLLFAAVVGQFPDPHAQVEHAERHLVEAVGIVRHQGHNSGHLEKTIFWFRFGQNHNHNRSQSGLTLSSFQRVILLLIPQLVHGLA